MVPTQSYKQNDITGVFIVLFSYQGSEYKFKYYKEKDYAFIYSILRFVFVRFYKQKIV